jgi:hypothetical protein
MSDWLKYGDLLIKVIPAIGVVAFLLISQSFVTRNEYMATAERFSGRIEAVEKLLIRMESSQETDKRHDLLLADHESRIRGLEKH